MTKQELMEILRRYFPDSTLHFSDVEREAATNTILEKLNNQKQTAAYELGVLMLMKELKEQIRRIESQEAKLISYDVGLLDDGTVEIAFGVR